MTNASERVLTGAALARFLDRLQADLQEASPSEMDLSARLAAQPMRADTLETLFRLSSLWLNAGDATRAQAVILDDREAVLAGTIAEQRDDVRMHLALLRLWFAGQQHDEAAALAALRQAREIVEEAGPRLVWRDGGGPIADNAGGYGDWDILSECGDWTLEITLAVFDLQRALHKTDPDLTEQRAVSEAHYFAACAQALHQAGQAERARQAAQQAMQAIATAAPPQTVNCGDWLAVADSVIEAAPDLYAGLAKPITKLTAKWPQPKQREIQIRLNRLKARAAHAQGDIAAALALRDTTNCSLDPCGSGEDDFFEYDFPWLIEAGRYDDAGRRALFYVYNFAAVCEHWELLQPLVHERLADEKDTSLWWPLYVMRICAYGDYLFEDAFGEVALLPTRSPVHARLFAALTRQSNVAAAAAEIYSAARALAEERSPGHPWIERLSIIRDHREGRLDDAQLLSRLEALIAKGFNDGATLHRTFIARIKLLGLARALQVAAPVACSAQDGYSFACWTDLGANSKLDPEPMGVHALLLQCPRTERAELIMRWSNIQTTVYEQARARMERFFETGEGHPFDASPHQYSQICMNLSTFYRDQQRYDDAMALHITGIAVSPFVEHYAGLADLLQDRFYEESDRLGSRAKKKLREQIVDAVGNLWQYATTNGYGRCGDLNHLIFQTVAHLNYLNRFDEIPLWLERLVQWQEHHEGEDPTQLSQDALYARVMCLQYMIDAPKHRSTAIALAQPLRSQVQASDHERTQLIFGNVLGTAQDYAGAISFYQRHIELNPRQTESQRSSAEDARKNILEYQGKLRRPWWQFWT